MKTINNRWIILLAASLMMLLACGKEVQKAAPIGDYTVLEQLATAYRTVGEQYSVQPQAMRSEGRRDFLRKVFKQAGYSYSATLLALADAKISSTNQDHRDFAELLLVPSKGLDDEALASIYSAEERRVVSRLKAIF